MRYASGSSSRHRPIYRSSGGQGPHPSERIRPDTSENDRIRPTEVLGIVNGADSAHRSSPQPIFGWTEEGATSPQGHITRFQPGPYYETSSLIIPSGRSQTFQPGSNVGPLADPFQLYKILSSYNHGFSSIALGTFTPGYTNRIIVLLTIYSDVGHLYPCLKIFVIYAAAAREYFVVSATLKWISLLFCIPCF